MRRILYQVSDNLLSSAGKHLSAVLPWYSQPKLFAPQCRASNFKVNRGLYLPPGFPSQPPSVQELQFPSLLSFTFPWPCSADHAQCPLTPLTPGVFGYLFSTSLNTSRDGPRHTALCKGMRLLCSPWTQVSHSPAFLLLEPGLSLC